MSRFAVVAAALFLCVACDHSVPVAPLSPPPPAHTNLPPTVSITVPDSAYEGSGVIINVRASDPDGDSLTYRWDLGNGITVTGASQWTGFTGPGAVATAFAAPVYRDEGTYRFEVIVTDPAGAADTASATIAVQNVAPTIMDLTVPKYPSRAGDELPIKVQVSDAGVDDTVTATLDFGDGIRQPVQSGTVFHTYRTAGSYVVTFTVRDNDGAVATQTGANSINVYVDNGPGTIAGYDVIDLGTLGGNSAVPFGINDQGQVVGHSTTANGEPHAFVWENGAMRDLAPDRPNTRATIVTNSGIIAGQEYRNPNAKILTWIGGVASVVPTGGEGGVWLADVSEAGAVLGSVSDTHHDRSFVWNGGVTQPLGGLPAPSSGGNAFSWAKDMNDAGQVVGSSEVAEYAGQPISHAFIWTDGVMRDLGLLGQKQCDARPDISCGAADATDINNNGVVAGWSTDSSGYGHAVVWTNGTIRDLGRGWGIAINDAGDVLVSRGEVNDRSDGPSLWHGDTAIPIGSLGGRGTTVSALSESGSVVGTSLTATGEAHAFVWQRDRGMVDLGRGPAGTGRAAVAVAINSRGDIIGYTATCHTPEYGGVVFLYCSFDDESRAILWRRN